MSDKDNYRKKNTSIVMIGHKRIPSRQGGIEVVVDRLSVGLAERGYDVWAYNRASDRTHAGAAAEGDDAHKTAYGTDGEYENGNIYKGVHLVDIPAPPNSGFNAYIYAILSTIRATIRGFDIYHYHAEGPCVMLWLPALFRRRSRIVVTIHGLDWQRAKWGRFASLIIQKGEKQAVKHADEIVVLSRNVQRYFKDTYDRDTRYIPNGTDRPNITPPGLITAKYGLKGDDYILFVGRIVPEKGLHYLIDAYKQLDTDKKLVIAGGSGQADDYMQKIKEMADHDERIIMTGFVRGKLLAELYSNAYLYVSPSDVEGMSLSLLEAASYGNCCLISDIPENVEVLQDKAVTFSQGDVNGLRRRLKELLSDPDMVADTGRETSEYVCSQYSWKSMIDETSAVYSVLM